MEYGLIGGRLGHSYSKVIHEMLCGYRYDLCPLPTEEEVRAFMTRRQFRAINVTIPYKLVVMEYCSYIDPHAKAINAVNTIVNRNGLLYGYNTDYPASPICAMHTGWSSRTGLCSFWAPAAPTTPPGPWPMTGARNRSIPQPPSRPRKGRADLCSGPDHRGADHHQHHAGGHVPQCGRERPGYHLHARAGSRDRCHL